MSFMCLLTVAYVEMKTMLMYWYRMLRINQRPVRQVPILFMVTEVPLQGYRTGWSKSHDVDWGRAIAQTVSRRLPTAAVRVRSQVKSCGICGGQSGTGAGFLRVLRFPLASSHSTDGSS
jgi:hypothetical protein